MIKPNVRINVTLSEKSYEELRQSAQDADMDMSEFVRQSIRLFNYVQREKKAGKRLFIGTDDNVQREIVLP